MKLYVSYFDHPAWIETVRDSGHHQLDVLCGRVHGRQSYDATAARRASERQTTINWRRLNIFDDLGDRWYTSVVTWWLLFVVAVAARRRFRVVL